MAKVSITLAKTPGRILSPVKQRYDRLRLDKIPALLDASGIATMELASELSPFLTGFMSSHVTYTPFKKRGPILGWTVGWYIKDFTEAGFEPYFLYQEFGAAHVPRPQPSLGPAGDVQLPKLQAAMEDLFRREFTF